MAEERFQRRLAAIVSADVVGYSAMMGRDETGTLTQLKALRADFLHPKVAEYGGRIVKTTGDGTLIEFPSAVDAVQHAVAVQRGMAERNAGLPEEQQIRLRLGINLGDIVIDGDDIYGDGVNLAARLEALAEPGGVLVSDDVARQIQGKLDLAMEDLGEQRLKNIARMVRTYRIEIDAPSAFQSKADLADQPLPEKPSIAVLPFQNMSGDPEQEYFADGMAEDIITALSRFRGFFVIARNSSFSYKGRNVDIRQIARELGVRYVLEGSVRKGGDRLRITAQLIEAATGNHLWAERYDGELSDIFDLQDRITEGVVGAIEPSVRRAEIERARGKRPDSLDAYDLYLRALPQAWSNTPQEADRALDLLDQALAIDPNYITAHAIAGWCRLQRSRYAEQGAKDIADAMEHARKVIASGTDDAVALAFASFTLVLNRRYDAAVDAASRAIELNPNSAAVLARSALVNAIAGNDDAAIDHARRSIRLSPLDPMRYSPETALCLGLFRGGQYAEAAEAAQRAIKYNPGFDIAHALLAASYARLGRLAEAKEEARRLLDINPNFHRQSTLVKAIREADALTTAMREAGLPH